MSDRSWTSNSNGPILVTGGAGFIGSHLVRLLSRQGSLVRVLDLPNVDAEHLPRQNVQVVRGSICNLDDLRRVVDGCWAIIHLAADPNLWHRDRSQFDRVNHQGTRNVLAVAAEAQVDRVIHVSSESILARRDRREVINEDSELRPADSAGPYCTSKIKAEQAAMAAAASGQPVMVVSPTVPVGPGDHCRGPFTRLIEQCISGRIGALYLDGQVNLIDVRDVAAGIIAALERGRIGRRYLLAGEHWSVHRLLKTLTHLSGRRPPRARVPYLLALGWAHLEEMWCRLNGRSQPLATVTGVRLTRRSFQFDATATRQELGLSLRPCIKGLREAVAWLRNVQAMEAAAQELRRLGRETRIRTRRRSTAAP